jgi:predicted GNAT superfamily acetyltransferase
MKQRLPARPAGPSPSPAKSRDSIVIRHCHGIAEFQDCVGVEREVWKSADLDVVPIPIFVVAAETGGQVLGAYDGAKLVGFTMAIAGWRARKPFLHSHMTAVSNAYRDRGIGRRLKLFQREDALARGINLIEWTFDPLVTRNAYFNFMRLGAFARRYVQDAYGITTSPLHGSLPTDRLVAEWHLRSSRVQRVLGPDHTPAPKTSKKAVRITVPSNIEELRATHPSGAREVQSEVREQFLAWLKKGYAATAVASSEGGMDYILEPGSPK